MEMVSIAAGWGEKGREGPGMRSTKQQQQSQRKFAVAAEERRGWRDKGVAAAGECQSVSVSVALCSLFVCACFSQSAVQSSFALSSVSVFFFL